MTTKTAKPPRDQASLSLKLVSESRSGIVPTQIRPGAFLKLVQAVLMGKQMVGQAEFRPHDDGW